MTWHDIILEPTDKLYVKQQPPAYRQIYVYTVKKYEHSFWEEVFLYDVLQVN